MEPSRSGRVAGSVDPLAPLLALPGVSDAIESARSAVDRLLWDRTVGPRKAEVRAESALRGAWADAWFEGAESGLAQFRTGAAIDGSPVGRVLGNAVTLYEGLPGLVGIIGTAPAQSLARMHALAAHGFVPDGDLGRPRTTDVADDALRIGGLPDPRSVVDRMAALSQLLVTSTAPGVLVAAIAHAELAVLRPFGWGSGLVARAMLRLVLAQRGVDPEMLSAPELGLRAAGRPAYVRALRGYVEGAPQGVAGCVCLVAGAIEAGAGEPGRWVAGSD